jgi:hypothetical protein
MAKVRDVLRVCLTKNISYSVLESTTGVNRWYLWKIVNEDYDPPAWVKRRLGMKQYRDLFAMPERELRWSLENREEL